MTPPPMDRARIAAFVDGALTPEEAAAVAMHLADHPADQAYADDLFAANAALAAAFDAPLREPVPRAILDLVAPVGGAGGAQLLAFPRRGLAVAGGLALAASVGAAVVLFGRGAAEMPVPGPVMAGSEMADILDMLPSGVVQAAGDGREAMVLATLPTPDGFCRELELVDRRAEQIALALACLAEGRGWQIAVVVTEPLIPDAPEDGFVAADGAEMGGLSPYLDAQQAGLALSPDAEAALIAQGWRP